MGPAAAATITREDIVDEGIRQRVKEVWGPSPPPGASRMFGGQ